MYAARFNVWPRLFEWRDGFFVLTSHIHIFVGSRYSNSVFERKIENYIIIW